MKRETTRSITKEVGTEIIKRKIQATKEISRERKYDRRQEKEEDDKTIELDKDML